MNVRKKPERTCIACGGAQEKVSLIRLVRDKDGQVQVDKTGKQPGRGAYVCPGEACFAVARKRGSLARALRISVSEADLDRLEREICSLSNQK